MFKFFPSLRKWDRLHKYVTECSKMRFVTQKKGQI
jgi:hypothetical protein